MNKSAVVEILRTFSKDELAKFGDMVSSPYHNKRSNVTKLYKVLRNFAPAYPAEKIAKETLWKNIFPGKPYNYGIMKNLIFDLNKLAVKFLELEMHSKKTLNNDLDQLDAYRLRNLKSQFIKKAGETRKKLKTRPLDNLTYYYSYMIYCAEMSFLDYDFLFGSGNTDYHSGINESLLLFYCTNQLFHNINNIQYAYNRSADVDKEIHTGAMEIYEGSPYKNPYTDILKLSYKALTGQGSKEAYDKLKTVFFENYKKCAKNIQYDLTISMLNFCRNNAQRGSNEFIGDEFLYIKLMIEEKLYVDTTFGWMDQYLFMNSVMSACRAGKFEWAEQFIEKHKKELLDSLREQYTNYAYITLNLRRERFQDALHYISKCKNVDSGDKLNIRVFEFNAYYELGHYEELKALADTTNHFLRSDKLFSAEGKADFKNYVKAISWLMDYRFGAGKKQGDKNFLDDILAFVKGNKMRNKVWLLRKIEELSA